MSQSDLRSSHKRDACFRRLLATVTTPAVTARLLEEESDAARAASRTTLRIRQQGQARLQRDDAAAVPAPERDNA